MKIAIAQMRVKANDLEANYQNMKVLIEEAVLSNVDLIVFPEMCVTGYLLSDRYLQKGFVELALSYNQRLLELSQQIGIIYGNLGANFDLNNRDGRFERYNQAYFAYQGKWLSANAFDLAYTKHCLPDYRIFDDSRYFKSGLELADQRSLNKDALLNPIVFRKDGNEIRIGLEICEDLWSQDYSIDPTDVYIQKGVDIIINLSSSPYTLNKEKSRVKRILEHTQKQKEKMVPILYVNATGAQNNGKNVLVFDGGSSLYGPLGEAEVMCNDRFEQELKIFTLGEHSVSPQSDNKILDGIIAGIRYFDEEVLGKRNWVIGLSGGIDSSINAALLSLALGSDRIFAYNMASRYNSLKTISVAQNLAKILRLHYQEGSIEKLVEATYETTQSFNETLMKEGLGAENIQARIRGHLLSSFSALHSAVICNNGNKVELALGYATLYGDTIGALSPLGDLTKVQLFDLAKAINQRFNSEIIPSVLIPELKDDQYIFELPPSAELKNAQIDPMKWGYHDFLVQYLMEYPSHSIHEWVDEYINQSYLKRPVAKIMHRYGLNEGKAFVEDLKWFMKAFHLGHFKRIQFPPIIVLSRASFGYDYRETQSPFIIEPSLESKFKQILQGVNHESI